MKDLKSMAAEINEWQNEAFCGYTEVAQINKVVEEINEYDNQVSKNDGADCFIQELADVFIASCGIRFEPMKNSFIAWVESELTHESVDVDVFIKAVQAKMIINRNRTWIKGKNGVYRHEEAERLYNPFQAIEKRSTEPIMDELKPMYDKSTGEVGKYE